MAIKLPGTLVYCGLLAVCTMLCIMQSPAFSEPEKKDEKVQMIGKEPRKIIPVFKEMLLSQSVFTPDKWWKYKTDDDDFHMVYCVEQSGSVNMGGQNPPLLGGRVLYRALACKDEAEARKIYDKLTSRQFTGKAVHIRKSRLPGTDQGVRLDMDTVNSKGVKVSSEQLAYMRYGRFVVELKADSNMKAMIARPAGRDRPFLSEPVFASALAGIQQKWAHYRQYVYKN